jgi:hypothetical protein
MIDILGNTMDTPFGGVTATTFVAFLACAWLLLKTASEGMSMWNRLSGKEPIGKPGTPMVTRKEERMLTLTEWTALEKRVETLEEKFDAAMKAARFDYERLAEAGEQRATRIMKALNESAGKQHGRIDQILAAVSKLEGQIEQMNT